MLHSKIYYMEFDDGNACAFIGSHNMTSFALNGTNGEASVLLEGHASEEQFKKIRSHIDEAQRQSIQYSPIMKESLAWWTREFIEGMRAEVQLPNPDDWRSARTILIFVQANKNERLLIGNKLYFEIPEGIDKIESLRTEAHLYLYDALPPDPRTALNSTDQASASYKCQILGVENKRGNLEVSADWEIEGSQPALLKSVPGSILRPTASQGMQQVRAEVLSAMTDNFEHQFETHKNEWDPVYADQQDIFENFPSGISVTNRDRFSDDRVPGKEWHLVNGLVPREGERSTRDRVALERASPDSGSYVLVSLRRRLRKADS
jgi:hypothetical protein